MLKKAVAASDGVIHLAFKHDIAFAGDFQGAADADRLAIETIADTLAGTNKPFAIASGLLGVAAGRVATETDVTPPMPGGLETRSESGRIVAGMGARGIRSIVVRLSPTCHGDGDNGFVPFIIKSARDNGVSAYVGDGSNRWPAVHRLDVAKLFRLAIESAPAGAVLHAVADEGVPFKQIAEVIGKHMNIPVTSLTPEAAAAHFTWMTHFVSMDNPASSKITRELLHWNPTHPGLIEDLDMGHYFTAVPTH